VNIDRERQELLELFYQCPVGLLEIDDRGLVRKVNPAAARMLAPVLGSRDLGDLFDVLRGLAPDVVARIEKNPEVLGPLAGGRRVLIPSSRADDYCLDLTAVRVQPDRVMIVLTDVTAEHRLAEREHRIALELQRSMLGRIDPIASVPVGVAYRAADGDQQVGGDWYDVIALPDDRVGLIVGDVAGHDLRATAAMGQLRSSVRAVAPFCADPAELVGHADRFAAEIDGAAFASMAYVIFDPRDGVAAYACAGHPSPLVVRGYRSADFLEDGPGPLLGEGTTAPRHSARAELAPGDALVLYTDGLYERRGQSADPRSRLRDLAVQAHHLPAAAFADQLIRDMLAGEPAADEICVLVIRREPAAEAAVPQRPGAAAPAS